jgi:hypothetical protein
MKTIEGLKEDLIKEGKKNQSVNFRQRPLFFLPVIYLFTSVPLFTFPGDRSSGETRGQTKSVTVHEVN